MSKGSPLKALLDTKKAETLVLGDVQRFMLKEQQKPSDRDPKVIHPSEMAKSDWCHRATYYRIATGVEHKIDVAFGLENVFDEGHDIHAKWHRRFRGMGVLRGIWRCRHCNMHWEATSPDKCARPTCGSKAVRYVEVPLWHEDYLIGGHADGEYDDPKRFDDIPLLEFKSIGLGTVRMEEPALLQKHAHKCETTTKTIYDLDKLWSDIRRPFNSHLKQANVYMFCRGAQRMIFIYEFKPNQSVKEFVVKPNKRVLEPLLDVCLDIKYALARQTPPPCPNNKDGCADCKPYETENTDDSNTGTQDEEPRTGEGEGVTAREDAPREGRARSPRKTIRRVSRTPKGPRGTGGSAPDEGDVRVHGLGGLLERATGPR